MCNFLNGNNWWWIIILLLVSGCGDNACGGINLFNNGCGSNGCESLILILLLLSVCGGGNSCGIGAAGLNDCASPCGCC